jgi:hypothetical protein
MEKTDFANHYIVINIFMCIMILLSRANTHINVKEYEIVSAYSHITKISYFLISNKQLRKNEARKP